MATTQRPVDTSYELRLLRRQVQDLKAGNEDQLRALVLRLIDILLEERGEKE